MLMSIDDYGVIIYNGIRRTAFMRCIYINNLSLVNYSYCSVTGPSFTQLRLGEVVVHFFGFI